MMNEISGEDGHKDGGWGMAMDQKLSRNFLLVSDCRRLLGQRLERC